MTIPSGPAILPEDEVRLALALLYNAMVDMRGIVEDATSSDFDGSCLCDDQQDCECAGDGCDDSALDGCAQCAAKRFREMAEEIRTKVEAEPTVREAMEK